MRKLVGLRCGLNCSTAHAKFSKVGSVYGLLIRVIPNGTFFKPIPAGI